MKFSLNPCYTGTYASSLDALDIRSLQEGLNPCYTGTYASRLSGARFDGVLEDVLILVILELTLRVDRVANHKVIQRQS